MIDWLRYAIFHHRILTQDLSVQSNFWECSVLQFSSKSLETSTEATLIEYKLLKKQNLIFQKA